MGKRRETLSVIHDNKSRRVTFNKRKNGLMKKAFELASLCDCRIALMVIDREGRCYEYISANDINMCIKNGNVTYLSTNGLRMGTDMDRDVPMDTWTATESESFVDPLPSTASSSSHSNLAPLTESSSTVPANTADSTTGKPRRRSRTNTSLMVVEKRTNKDFQQQRQELEQRLREDGGSRIDPEHEDDEDDDPEEEEDECNGDSQDDDSKISNNVQLRASKRRRPTPSNRRRYANRQPQRSVPLSSASPDTTTSFNLSTSALAAALGFTIGHQGRTRAISAVSTGSSTATSSYSHTATVSPLSLSLSHPLSQPPFMQLFASTSPSYYTKLDTIDPGHIFHDSKSSSCLVQPLEEYRRTESSMHASRYGYSPSLSPVSFTSPVLIPTTPPAAMHLGNTSPTPNYSGEGFFASLSPTHRLTPFTLTAESVNNTPFEQVFAPSTCPLPLTTMDTINNLHPELFGDLVAILGLPSNQSNPMMSSGLTSTESIATTTTTNSLHTATTTTTITDSLPTNTLSWPSPSNLYESTTSNSTTISTSAHMVPSCSTIPSIAVTTDSLNAHTTLTLYNSWNKPILDTINIPLNPLE